MYHFVSAYLCLQPDGTYDKKPLDPKYFQNPPCHFMGEGGGGSIL